MSEAVTAASVVPAKDVSSDLDAEISQSKIENLKQKMNHVNHELEKRQQQRSRESDDENGGDDETSSSSPHAMLAAAQKAMAGNPFNPALFPPGQMQAFQNVVAQFTANAVANNMDNETVMNNVAVLQTALFTLQQQQILQFQLIQHLQSQLLKKGGDKASGDDGNDALSESESETTKEEERSRVSINKVKSPSPLRRLEEQTCRAELDLR